MQLPPLLQWQIQQTDAEPCGAFCVQFAHAPELLPELKLAARFYAEHEGRRVMTGVVDDVTVILGRDGLLAELTGRSMAALLMRNSGMTWRTMPPSLPVRSNRVQGTPALPRK